MIDDLLGERQVVLALDVLGDLIDVDLQEVLCIGADQELQEPLRLLVDFFERRAARLHRPHAGSNAARRLQKLGRLTLPEILKAPFVLSGDRMSLDPSVEIHPSSVFGKPKTITRNLNRRNGLNFNIKTNRF